MLIYFGFSRIIVELAMSIRHSDWDAACKVYVGGLTEDANK